VKSPDNPVSFLHRTRGEPLAELTRWRAGQPSAGLLLVEFEFRCWWLSDANPLPLTAVYFLKSPGQIVCAVTDCALVASATSAQAQIEEWAAKHALALFEPGRPLRLEPVFIPKPWGQEIWYTGVEARGVCCFSDGVNVAPIPWVQAVMPAPGAGEQGAPLVLLKILDPLPEEVTGDLYFELHTQKREVYVVTHVDETAWPGGAGAIRFGFDPAQVANAGSRDAFCEAYLGAVREYEEVRREIDALPESSPPSAELRSREAALRQRMNAFTHLRELRVGDVVVVPLCMPHSLQHGVRTIEFQTPVYERKILSFAQKVLTQAHWDTAEAVQQMILQPPPQVPFERLPAGAGVAAERIVDFPDFEVRRLRLEPGSAESFAHHGSYVLVMVVEGQMELTGVALQAEQAAYLPPGYAVELRSSQPAQPLVLLLAMPRG